MLRPSGRGLLVVGLINPFLGLWEWGIEGAWLALWGGWCVVIIALFVIMELRKRLHDKTREADISTYYHKASIPLQPVEPSGRAPVVAPASGAPVIMVPPPPSSGVAGAAVAMPVRSPTNESEDPTDEEEEATRTAAALRAAAAPVAAAPVVAAPAVVVAPVRVEYGAGPLTPVALVGPSASPAVPSAEPEEDSSEGEHDDDDENDAPLPTAAVNSLRNRAPPPSLVGSLRVPSAGEVASPEEESSDEAVAHNADDGELVSTEDDRTGSRAGSMTGSVTGSVTASPRTARTLEQEAAMQELEELEEVSKQARAELQKLDEAMSKYSN